MNTEVSVHNGVHQWVSARAEDLPLQITEFLESAHRARESLRARQRNLEQRLAKSEAFVADEVKKIQSLVDHFQGILKHAGAKEWRGTAENLQKEGKQQVQVLQSTLGDIKKSVKETCLHLENASTQIIKNLSKTLNNLNSGDIEQLAEDSCHEVKGIAMAATKQMVDVGRWFHWKNLALVFVLSLIVVIATDLFIEGEWPWESHKSALKERVAGQALLESWPQLSLSDQQRILSNVA